jgi:hypothetical protein
LVLDAPVHQESPLTVNDLQLHGHARVPASQQEAGERGTRACVKRDRDRNVMRDAKTVNNDT